VARKVIRRAGRIPALNDHRTIGLQLGDAIRSILPAFVTLPYLELTMRQSTRLECAYSIVFSICAVILLSASTATAADPAPTTPPPPLVIGAILPLSGELAAIGAGVKNGIELALTKLPPAVRSQIQVIFEDDAFLPKNTLTAFQKLTTLNNATVIIGFGSATGNAISSISEERGVVLVSISSDPAISAGKRFVFSFWVTPEAETALVIPQARQRGYSRIARITAIHDGTFAARAAFDKQNQGELKIVIDEECMGDLKNLRPFLTKLKNAGPFDAFLPITFPEQLGVLARQAREMGFKQPFFGYESFEDSSAIKLAQGALTGAWFATYGTGDDQFSKEFTERYPDSMTIGAGNGYDLILILAKSKAAGRSSSQKIAADLHTLKDFTGALGTYSATGDNRFGLPAALKVVAEDGSVAPL